ncbi:MAG: ABC transporter permease [Flavobacteriales bacterium]|nr:MAG: ABC transporter permease [Flavobacteriales bacterium]
MQAESIEKENWTTILKPKTGWFDINLNELWQYRDLIFLFVRRDFVSIYKQTILGPIWFIIQPLLTTIMFTVVFGKIANIPTDGLPPMLFYMAGTVAWTYFSESLNKTSNTFTANASIFGKVYFPRLAIPISIVISNLFTFIIQFVFFLCFMLFFYLKGAEFHPNKWVLLTPVLLLVMAMLGLGMGIIISSMTTKYRDLRFAVGFGVQLWMYGTPVVYPLSEVPEKWKFLFAINPMSSIIETFRYAFLGKGAVNIDYLAISGITTIILLVIGIVLFSKIEKNFMDTV